VKPGGEPIAVALAAIIAGFNLLLAHSLSRNADQIGYARAADALALLQPVDGRLVVREAPDEAAPDSPVWIFSGGETLEAPVAGKTVSRAARNLADGPRRSVNVPARRHMLARGARARPGHDQAPVGRGRARDFPGPGSGLIPAQEVPDGQVKSPGRG